MVSIELFTFQLAVAWDIQEKNLWKLKIAVPNLNFNIHILCEISDGNYFWQAHDTKVALQNFGVAITQCKVDFCRFTFCTAVISAHGKTWTWNTEHKTKYNLDWWWYDYRLLIIDDYFSTDLKIVVILIMVYLPDSFFSFLPIKSVWSHLSLFSYSLFTCIILHAPFFYSPSSLDHPVLSLHLLCPPSLPSPFLPPLLISRRAVLLFEQENDLMT